VLERQLELRVSFFSVAMAGSDPATLRAEQEAREEVALQSESEDYFDLCGRRVRAKGNLEIVQQPIFLAAFGSVEFGLIDTQIKLEVKVAPGAIPQTLIVQEIKALQATWVIFDRFVFVTNDHFSCFQDLNFLCVLNANLILVCAQNGTCAPCGSKIIVKESKLQTKS
jgi:hypothetical protein